MEQVKVNGWTFSPVDETWAARVGENRWLVVKGTLDNPPSFRPEV